MTAAAVDVTQDEPPGDTPRPPRRRIRYRGKDVALAYALLLPSFLIFAIFFYLPFFRLLNWGRYQSLRGGQAYRDVQLWQYKDTLTGPDFRAGLWHSIQFVLLTVPAGLILGILLAVAAHRRLKGIKVFQAIFSSTLASSVAVSSVLFLFIFNKAVGVIREPIGIGIAGHDIWRTNPANWAQESSHAMWAAALPSIWQNLGLAFVIVLAGLQAVPDEIMEAATLDGYGPVRRLMKITLPLISPVLLFLTIVLVVFGFQAYAQIDIITSGGPTGASETLVFKVYALRQNLGKGAVMSIGLFLVTLVVSGVQFGLLNRRVHYGDE